MRARPPLVIAETRHGFVCASAGVDASNAPGPGTLVLLPLDPDASARRLRDAPARADGRRRRRRSSATRSAAPGARARPTSRSASPASPPLLDLRGTRDAAGYELRSTQIAVADEIAGAAELVMGKTRRASRRRSSAASTRAATAPARDLVMPARARPLPLAALRSTYTPAGYGELVTAVLVTGMSGTGKSTALVELARRGHRVVDTDYGGWTEDVPSSDGETERLWCEDRIDALLGEHDDGVLFVSGCVSNQGKFYPRFDAVVLLSAPADVILGRVAVRETNDYGKTDAPARSDRAPPGHRRAAAARRRHGGDRHPRAARRRGGRARAHRRHRHRPVARPPRPLRTIRAMPRRYAVAGTTSSPALERLVRDVAEEFEKDDFEAVERRRRRRLRAQHVRGRDPEGVPPQVARHVLGGVLRARRGSRGRAQGELPDARAHALERRPPARARARASWFTTMEHGHVPGLRGPARDLRAARPAREVEARDRERVRPRPRARALGRRRDHRATSSRQASGMRRARPAAGAVPGARVPARARPAPRDAPLPGRRPLLRQPLGAQGRDALLDERQRRRQVAARDGRPRHPARHGLRRARTPASSSACRRASSRAASRSTRSSTG